jgi:glycine cleavage system H protein
MEEVFYTRDHFWVSIEGDLATVGLTDYILNGLKMVTLINLPQISDICNKTELVGGITYNESDVFEIFSPFSGDILDVNDLLIDSPEQLFSNIRENSWLFRIFINSPDELEDLISEEEYAEYIEEI